MRNLNSWDLMIWYDAWNKNNTAESSHGFCIQYHHLWPPSVFFSHLSFLMFHFLLLHMAHSVWTKNIMFGDFVIIVEVVCELILYESAMSVKGHGHCAKPSWDNISSAQTGISPIWGILSFELFICFLFLLPPSWWKVRPQSWVHSRKSHERKKKKKILKDDKFMADILVSFNIVNNVAGNKKIDHFQLIFYITE